MEEFETYRTLLFVLAYRMVSSASEAEDIVQDTYVHLATALRALGTSGAALAPEHALARATVRLCLGHAETVRWQRADYLGPWLPEPVLTPDVLLGPLTTPAQRQSLLLAVLTSLDAHAPVERAAYLLHDVFSFDAVQVAGALDRDATACREFVARVRDALARRQPPVELASPDHRPLVGRFLAAWRQSDERALRDLLAPDVIAWADAGGKVPAATRPVSGQDPVLRYLLGLLRKAPLGPSITYDEVNCAPALLSWAGDEVESVVALDAYRERIQTVRVLLNTDKLVYLRHQLLLRAEDGPRALL